MPRPAPEIRVPPRAASPNSWVGLVPAGNNTYAVSAASAAWNDRTPSWHGPDPLHRYSNPLVEADPWNMPPRAYADDIQIGNFTVARSEFVAETLSNFVAGNANLDNVLVTAIQAPAGIAVIEGPRVETIESLGGA